MIAKNLIARGMTPEEVVQLASLPVEVVRAL